MIFFKYPYCSSVTLLCFGFLKSTLNISVMFNLLLCALISGHTVTAGNGIIKIGVDFPTKDEYSGKISQLTPTLPFKSPQTYNDTPKANINPILFNVKTLVELESRLNRMFYIKGL